MMDLKQLLSATGSMIGDPSFRQIQRPEAIGFLNMAQQELVSMVWDYDRTKFLVVDTQTSTSGTADYLVPAVMRQIVRVLYAGKEYMPIAPEDLEALTVNDYKRPIKGVSGFYTEMQGSEPGRSQVRLFPTPNTTTAGEVEIWYYQAARDFHPQGVYPGTATGGKVRISSVAIAGGGTGYTLGDTLTVSGGTAIITATLTVTAVASGVITAVAINNEGAYTTAPGNPASVTGGTGAGATFTITWGNGVIVDTGAPFLTTGTAYTNFWLGANVLFTSGSNDGQYRRVKSVNETNSLLTLDTDLPTAIASTNTYEIRQVSILPPHLHHIMPYYAAWLAAPQTGKDGTPFKLVWEAFIQGLKNRYLENVRVHLPGEVLPGIAPLRTPA